MEFSFNVDNVLGDEVTKVDNNLRPYRNNHASSTYRSQLSTVIDEMGAASAKAQGLNGAITSASRLAHSDHRLYIMKDEKSSNGNGSVVGILKVGCKKLFIYDHNGRQHEKDPLCVLDFYVHESKQRMGCGKKLFEAMLQAEQVKPVHLAIDRPSAKFSSFLARHYGLKAIINQVNNFVIFEGFFRDRPAESVNNRRHGKPPLHPYKQNSADRWQHQDEHTGARREPSSANVQAYHQREVAGIVNEERVWDRRHGSPSLLAWSEPSASIPSQPTNERKEALKNVLPRENSADGGEPMSNGKRNSLPSSPVHRAMGAHQNMYSRHPEVGGNQPTPETIRSGTPPMLRRDGPSQDFLAMAAAVNAHSYQDRRGHLVVSSGTSPTKELPSKTPTQQGESSSRLAPTQLIKDTSWNVLGVPRSAQRSASNQRHQHTRLW